MKQKKFLGTRLKVAMQFRGLGVTDIAKKVDLSKQSISLYVNDDNVPPYENILKLAYALDFPYEFFMTEDKCQTITDNTYFRSQASATKKERISQSVKLEYVAKMYEVLLNYIDFPDLDIPKVDFIDADNPIEYDAEEVFREIEKISLDVRSHWNLGLEPIENLQLLLEKHGLILTGFSAASGKIDAFSQRIRVKKGIYMYIIALVLGKKPMQRLRFDMAHELGHVLLHPWGDTNESLTKEEFNGREKQANMFASAFLLPQETFGKDVAAYPLNLEYYAALKKKWNMSMQAMMYRARQLEIISANQFQYLMRQVSKHGWRTAEPGDAPGTMHENIFQSAIGMLFEQGYLNARSLMREFANFGIILQSKDIESLLQLKEGTLRTNNDLISIVRVKPNIKG